MEGYFLNNNNFNLTIKDIYILFMLLDLNLHMPDKYILDLINLILNDILIFKLN